MRRCSLETQALRQRSAPLCSADERRDDGAAQRAGDRFAGLRRQARPR